MYRSLILSFLILLSGVVFAQTNTNTPYSARGIGDVRPYGNAYITGLGGITTTTIDSSQVNLFNPSSYSSLAKQLPLFSFGVDYAQKSFSTQNLESTGGYLGITHISLAIPFANRFGVAAGLKPFGRSGYEIKDYEMIQGDSLFYEYAGRGGVQEFLIGFSANVIDELKHSLSVGINGKRYFGKIDNERKVYKMNKGNLVGGMDVKSIYAKDYGVELGVNYDFRPSLAHSVKVGAIYRPRLNQNFEKDHTRFYFGNFYKKPTYDTIINTETDKGKVFIPSKASVGIAYKYSPVHVEKSRKLKHASLMVAFEYSYEDWSNYKEEFSVGINEGVYSNSNSYRVGVEFIPNSSVVERSNSTNYLSKVSYRLGAYLINTPYEHNGEQFNDNGISIGLGFPFVISRAVSTFNISGSYGVLGNRNSIGSVQENYYGLNFGINIAPGYDRWFRKYKLD